ncbi:shikimate dehydrogenase [Corynebacterium cystitidis]|uniref:shikimate dehydrogenase (NADP(+)) n=1 Tax=Corynebacterium cystitidis DSM 20524 TaxID=1121357 RepID=A0A1H9PGF3_9CORY|nr:shikimate dehydrogenase [Corynebacterium cystitidis]WJY82522.1 Shikimate dehydrogenase [Corynebacterium cystitidis DSM 20524]SER46643.1 shikimate dehydrogenase [Corynebacterium cystitidis DSM 20524]SNV74848.1 shikimate 5-dehydrogenase [Corynebacterium cystitidis]
MSTLTSATYKAAVLGLPVEHSLSPVLHGAGFSAAGLDNWEYERIECSAEDLPRIVGQASEDYRGFSVTMPGKFAALEFADEVTERARLIGAANTLVRTEVGWRADNTDCEGILYAFSELIDDQSTLEHVVLIGAGGTARPAVWALGTLGVERITMINRSDRRAEFEELIARFDATVDFVRFDAELESITMSADAIISTVPSAGIEDYVPQLGHAPVLDVIYDPWPTPLVIRAAANGYRTVGGHVMLAGQAYSQFAQFTGVDAPREAMRRALEDRLG